jgi:hypothetical protein
MAGILNNKERIIDFIMTEEGERQAASGQMKIEYATLTDLHTFYAASGSSGPGDVTGLPTVAADATKRVFFEATKRYQDTIVPELEDGTTLRAFRISDFEFGGKIIASGTNLTGFAQRSNIMTGSEITNVAARTLDGIINNFRDLRILGTIDEFSDSSSFVLSPATGSFKLTPHTKLNRSSAEYRSNMQMDVNLANIPSLFEDGRFSHFSNFSYLPPVNVRRPGESKGKPLGLYPELNEPSITTAEDLDRHLEGRQYVQVDFLETSAENNLIGQVFEYSFNEFEKLSIIDYGEFAAGDPYDDGKRIFFVGKIKRDANGSETFLNIFTLVFS